MAGVTYKLDPKGFHKWISNLGYRYEEAALRGMRSGAKACIPLLHESTQQAPPASDYGQVGAFNTGKYMRAWKTEKTDSGVVVFNDKPYASIIEDGRRGGRRRPPKKAIAKWAQRRLGMSAEEAKHAAWPIASAIARRGLQGRHVLSDVLGDMIKIIIREIRHELDVELGK